VSRDRLKTAVIGLSIACPFDQSNPEGCPLCSIRKKPVKERLEWVKSLSDEELAAIYRYHGTCIVARERRAAEGAKKSSGTHPNGMIVSKG